MDENHLPMDIQVFNDTNTERRKETVTRLAPQEQDGCPGGLTNLFTLARVGGDVNRNVKAGMRHIIAEIRKEK